MRSSATLVLLFWLPASGVEAEESRFADGQIVGLEVGLGVGWPPDTAYTRTLETFGFVPDHTLERFRFSAAIEVIALRYVSVLLQTNSLGRREWERDGGIGPNDRFEWTAWTLDVHFRVFYPIARWARVYTQFGVGPVFTPTTFDTRAPPPRDSARYEELQVGYNVAGLGGVEALAGDHVGFFLQGGYFYAPTPKNELGERHQTGGGLLMLGLSFRFARPR